MTINPTKNSMKNILTISFVLLLSYVLTSCTEVMKVNLGKDENRLVVDGLVTNRLAPFRVKLSTTVALDDQNGFPAVNDALVIIGDNAGNIDTLGWQGDGVYLTNGPRQGVVGRTYFLTVVSGGKTYVAQDILTSVSPIDTMYVVFLEKGAALGIQEDGYYAYFNSTDPPNQKNFYLEDATKDGASVLRSDQIAIFDDKFLSPVILGARIPGRYESGEKIVFTLSSLSEAGYNYLNGVALQLQNDGGFFSTPPANAPTNLSSGALGFFRASSLTSDSLIVP